MIEGVEIKPLKKICDERGMIMHMLRCDDPGFEKFGEIYFSCIYPSVIKAWHLHDKMTLNYAVVNGMIKVVLYDNRKDSNTNGDIMEVFIGDNNYVLLTVPPNIWNGFKCVGTERAIVANCATIPHDPDEIHRCDPFENNIPYKWELKNG